MLIVIICIFILRGKIQIQVPQINCEREKFDFRQVTTAMRPGHQGTGHLVPGTYPGVFHLIGENDPEM
jgi:hypothetical protein